LDWGIQIQKINRIFVDKGMDVEWYPKYSGGEVRAARPKVKERCAGCKRPCST
jgi:hypothetical protein